jgi:hypothetical protein
VKAVVAFALRLLPAAESWTGISTPFAILEGALITTADHLQSKPGRPMEIVTQVYRVNPAAVRPLRRQVIDAILNSLSSANRRQAFAAADLLEHTVRYPVGWPELPLSDPEKASWTEEFQDTLQRLNAMLDLHNLPAPVLVRVAQSVARYSFHTNGHLPNPVLAPAATAVLVRLDRDLPTRLCRHLMDGWCYLTWNRKEQVRIRLHASLATVLEREQPDSNALMQEINAALEQFFRGERCGAGRDVSEIDDSVEAGVRQRVHFFFLSTRASSMRSRKPVLYLPARKSLFCMISSCNGMVVLIPVIMYSPSARRMRAMACSRVEAWTMSLAIIES